MSPHWLRAALRLGPDETPFPWQERLLESFQAGVIPPALDIPTGLGKTAVMAVWLVARAGGAQLPRRLVYVVDRRAVVDQATTVAEGLRCWVDANEDARNALGLRRSLPISTLRGQHVDNREWLEDPSAPAIIVGTVDMVGSRLLFEGYGVSRKMRPFHAGLIGADTLLVLDEAHLVPPFERLLDAIANGGECFGPRDASLRAIVPRFALLPLSATGRAVEGALGLTEADLGHDEVRKRLHATKRLHVRELEQGFGLAEALAAEAWKLGGNGTHAMRCIVFCDKREDARRALDLIEKWKKGDKKAGMPPAEACTELFVGGRRVFEREDAARRLAELGFVAGDRLPPDLPIFLFATSAAEVGVDLDADHMVCDLVAWERMVQRLGRVNRRGNGEAEVIVLAEPPRAPNRAEQKALDTPEAGRNKKQLQTIANFEHETADARARRRALAALPHDGVVHDASPGAIRDLKSPGKKSEGVARLLRAASTPEPLRPALTRALVDAWSMTSLEEHTGRPEIEPWLRGWVEKEPRTSLVWRRHLPARRHGPMTPKRDVEAFFEAAPPQLIETLETETYRAVAWMMARAEAVATSGKPPSSDDASAEQLRPLGLTEIGAIALTPAGDLRRSLSLAELLDEGVFEGILQSGRASAEEKARARDLRRNDERSSRERTKEWLCRMAVGATLVVDQRLGGLAASGLLDERADELPTVVDDDARPLWPVDDGVPRVRFRVRMITGPPPAPHRDWRHRFRLAIREPDEGDATYLVVDKWRHDAATEEDRSAGRPQGLDEHQAWAEKEAGALADRLALPGEYRALLCAAARLHDEGKRAPRWQRAFNAPRDGGIYAKTLGPLNIALLEGYRHELGSVPHAERDDRLCALAENLRDLALHMIAAHHGFALPIIRTTGCEAPPSALEDLAREVALRFARLQKSWGPWGLAWWDALLRAADQQASRRNEEKGDA